MILAVRGGYASGKTTLCQQLIAEFPHREVRGLGEKRTPWFYEVGDDLLVTRRGENMNINALRGLLEHFAAEGRNVVFEHVHSTRGTWIEPSVRLPIWWAVLDTPVEVSLERANARRKTGTTDPSSVRTMAKTVQRETQKAQVAGVPCVTLNYEHAFGQLCDLLVCHGVPLPLGREVFWKW